MLYGQCLNGLSDLKPKDESCVSYVSLTYRRLVFCATIYLRLFGINKRYFVVYVVCRLVCVMD